MKKEYPFCVVIQETVLYALILKYYLLQHELTCSPFCSHATILQETANSLSSLIIKYFEVVDPVYPMIHYESFLRDYEFFWSVVPAERPSVDGSLVALIFVMLAMGTQFVTLPSSDDKEQTAEFYGKTPTLVYEGV